MSKRTHIIVGAGFAILAVAGAAIGNGWGYWSCGWSMACAYHHFERAIGVMT